MCLFIIVFTIMLHKAIVSDPTLPSAQFRIDAVCLGRKELLRTFGTSCSIFVDVLKHMQKKRQRSKQVNLYLISLLLSNSFAPEPNPGPLNSHQTSVPELSQSVRQCGTCDNTVQWNTRVVCCNECGQWYHARCQFIDTSHLHQDDMWCCAVCDNRNSQTLFEFPEDDTTSELLTTSLLTPSRGSIGRPIHASTPVRTNQSSKRDHRPLRVLNLNLQSATGKKPEIIHLIDSVRPDIVMATETWLDSIQTDAEIFPDTYKVYRKDRNRHGGGVLLAVKNTLDSYHVPELQEDCELIWVKLKLKGKRTLYLCAYYRPNVSDEEGLRLFSNSISRATAISNAHVLIGGDMNFPGWDWRTMSLKPNAVHPRLHNDFVDILSDNGLEQLVLSPTRRNNILDLMITNCPQLISRVEVIPGLSDHDAVYCEFSINPKNRKQTPRLIPLYKKANWTGLKGACNDIIPRMRSMRHAATTEELWTFFKDSLSDAIAKFIPHKVARSKESKPWINPSLRRLINRKNRLFKKMRKTGNEDTKTEYVQLRGEVQRQLRRAYWHYLNSIFEGIDPEQRTKDKRFWTYIKHLKSSNVGVAPLKENGHLISDPKRQAQILNSQFQSVFSEGRGYNQDEFNNKCAMPPHNSPVLEDITITVQGVRKLLTNLDPNKASGPDNLSTRVLKELSDEVAPILTMIFRSSLESGMVPADWKTALVTPVFKKGQRNDPANYRPVSLTSVCCKTLEHILTSTIMNHLENNEIMSSQQHGFRKKRSCETQLLGFTNELIENTSRGQQTDILIMDFAKAFDKVNHSLLIHKLRQYGVVGKINQWILDFLTSRRQAVVVNGVKSGFIDVKSGVPQGSVLGPCLFLVYINDLPNNLRTRSRLFADDTAIYTAVDSMSDQLALQQDLNALASWERKWDMQFHPQKCVSLPVTRCREPLPYQYVLHSHTLDTVRSAKYLGITIKKDIGWSDHIENVCSKANRALGFLKRNLKIKSWKIKDTAYKAYVRPILEYASTIWDPHQQQHINRIESVQRRAARFVVRDFRRTSSVTDIMKRLEWRSLEERRRVARLTMLYKILHETVAVEDIKVKLTPLPERQRRGHGQQFLIPRCRTEYHLNSFLPKTISDWNALPEETVQAVSVNSFINMLCKPDNLS